MNLFLAGKFCPGSIVDYFYCQRSVCQTIHAKSTCISNDSYRVHTSEIYFHFSSYKWHLKALSHLEDSKICYFPLMMRTVQRMKN